MGSFAQKIKNLWKDEKGITAIEYGFLAGLIALAIITGAAIIGGDLNTLFENIANFITAP